MVEATRKRLTIVCTLVLVAVGCAPGNQAGTEEETAQAEQTQTREGERTKEGGNSKAPETKRKMKKMMERDKSEMPSDKDVRATARQPEGQVTYWVLPGERRLDTYFGTRENPKLTADVPEGAPPPVKQLIEDLPILIGVPEEARTYRDGEAYTAMPTPFGDDGVPVEDSSFEITYIDRQAEDQAGPPFETADEVETNIEFTDPDGNNYELEPRLVFQPPIPGYETEGGVKTDVSHHGTTGTGSPLMPEVYSWGAFWAITNVRINGEVADKNKVAHCMTTETVRNTDYELAMQDDLPLAKDETIAGQRHHTHCIVLPITFTPEGPKHEPVETAFELSNGETQPFIHIMYENDELGEGPDWGGPSLDQ